MNDIKVGKQHLSGQEAKAKLCDLLLRSAAAAVPTPDRNGPT